MFDLTPQNLLVLLAVGVSNTAVALWWLDCPGPVARARAWVTARAARSAALLVIACIAIWVGIFLVYRFPVSGDTKVFYQAQGRAALRGGIPDATYNSSYMPLFSYLMGLVDALWSSDLSIPLFLTLCFTGIGLLLPRLEENREAQSKKRALGLSLIAILNGACCVLAIGYQQDETLLLLFALVAMLLMLKGQDARAGIAVGLGLLATKILFVISAWTLFLHAANRRRFLLGAAVSFLLPMALFLGLGTRPERMLSGEAHSWEPPSLVTLVGVLPSAYAFLSRHSALNHGTVGLWCLLGAFLFRRRTPGASAGAMIRAMIGLWLGFLLLSQKSLPTYRLVILPLLPGFLDRRADGGRWVVLLFCLYSTVLGIQWMFYENWIARPYAVFLEQHLHDPRALSHLVLQLIMDAVILGSEIVWLLLCLRDRSTQCTSPSSW